MEFYWCTSGTWFDLLNDRTTDVVNPLATCIAHRFDLHISSKLVRAAVLFYSSFRKEGKLCYLGMQYLAEFYQRAREAIDREYFIELLYACYFMCLYELVYKREFSGDFEAHAGGFLISYQNLIQMGIFTVEEYSVMGQAYEWLVKMTNVASSKWHQDEYWFPFIQTVIQRLDSATSRTLYSAMKTSGWKGQSVWLQKSHQLLGTENLVYQLCTLFNRLAMILRNEMDGHFDWDETAAAVESSLNTLAQIIFSRSSILIPQTKSVNLFVLNHGVSTLSEDKFTSQMLSLYYMLLLQYRIMVQELSDSMWLEVIETSNTICRLFTSPHKAQYCASEIHFMANRGVCVAVILVAISDNIRSKSFLRVIS